MSRLNYLDYYTINFDCTCGIGSITKKDKLKIQCSLCGVFQHCDCIKNANKMVKYICPTCQLKHSDLFQKILYYILPPSLFKYKSNKKVYSTSYSFIIDFSFYKSFEKLNEKDDVYIIFKSLKLEEKGFSFHWPLNSKIVINNKTVLNLQDQGPKTKLDRPIVFSFKNSIDKNIINDANIFPYDGIILEIENYFKDLRVNRLEIIIENAKNESSHPSYIISVYFCEIIKNVKDVISGIQTISNIKNLNTLLNKSINLSVLHEKVPLIDIYTKSDRIVLPARGFDCMHLPVFDLETFLIMNRRNKKFECPFCKRIANRLYIDGMILNYIKEEDKKENQKKVFLLDFNYNKYEYKDDDDDAIFNYNTNDDYNKNHHNVENNNDNKEKKMEEEIDLS